MPGKKTFRQGLEHWLSSRQTRGSEPTGNRIVAEAARLHEAEVAGLRARVDEVERQRDDAYLQAAQDVDELNHQLCQAEKRVEELETAVTQARDVHHRLGAWPDCPGCVRLYRQDEEHCAENARLREALEQIKALYRDWDSDQSTYYPSELAREMAQISNRALAPQGGEVAPRGQLDVCAAWVKVRTNKFTYCKKLQPCPDHPKPEEGK